mmetsp:Transcript_21471/g.44169  ORF Transcript_21471/g.44169 Transcript_21471/m.44169 type:complete len:363 (+) Transcript_21471:1111-2199(+)
MGGALLTEPSALAMSKYPSLASSYKGIMVTSNELPKISPEKKRPKCSPKTKTAASNESFICGTVKKPWGTNVVIEEKTRVLKRTSSKDSAICKHKAWLKEMQVTREQAERERMEKERGKEERLKEFMSKQAAKRAVILDRADDSNRNESVSGASSKPVWAMTEDAAQVATKEAESKEEDELLSFVENLDFDQYSHDMELKILMDQVKERIRTLQKEKNMDESRLQAVMDSELAAMRAESLGCTVSMDDLNGSGPEDGDGGRCNSDDEIMSIADTVRSESSTIGSIHSQRSMQALVARSKEKIGTTSVSNSNSFPLETISETPIMEAAMTPPVWITHTDDDGARIAEAKSINKLPFMNRNPAL